MRSILDGEAAPLGVRESALALFRINPFAPTTRQSRKLRFPGIDEVLVTTSAMTERVLFAT